MKLWVCSGKEPEFHNLVESEEIVVVHSALVVGEKIKEDKVSLLLYRMNSSVRPQFFEEKRNSEESNESFSLCIQEKECF